MDEVIINAIGLRCPMPIILAAKQLPKIAVGQSLTLLADDPAAAFDVPAWCRMTGQELTSSQGSTFVIKKTS